MTPEQALALLDRATAKLQGQRALHFDVMQALTVLNKALQELAALKAAKPTEPDAATSGS